MRARYPVSSLLKNSFAPRFVIMGHRIRIIEKSQPVKNRNLSRILANLSRLNSSSQSKCVFCFSTMFTLLQHQKVLVYPVIFPFFFWVHPYVSDYIWLQTGEEHTSSFPLFTTPTSHSVENLSVISLPFSVFILTTTGKFSTDIPASLALVLTQCFKIALILIFFECLFLCLRDYRVRKGYRTWRDLTMTFWNEIILAEIMENQSSSPESWE